MKKNLRSIVEDNTTRLGRIFDFSIQFLIFISLVAFTIESLPDKPEWLYHTVHLVEVICLIIFTVEYFLRIYVAEKPLKYIFSFYGLIDFLAILPFYTLGRVDMAVLRSFRVFRIFKALRLVGFHKAVHRIQIAARLVREEVALFLIATAILIFLASSGIYYFEHEAQPETFVSIPHSAWWAVVTLTTVGYGDVYPITTGGKIFTFFILIVGLGIITIPAGLVASALSEARDIESEE